MSKKQVAKKEGGEEEWEDVDEAEEGEEEEEEEDTTINNPDVVVKYKKCAVYVNEVLQLVIDACKPGARVVDVCTLGDAAMMERVNLLFRKSSKGIAFPTTITLNSCVANYSPAMDEEVQAVIALNDVAHIQLGCHIDGFLAMAAHTIHITEGGQLVPESREANIITAAHRALGTAIRKMRPGLCQMEVTEVIEHAAAEAGVNILDGVLSHQLKQYIIDGFKCIPGKNVPEHRVHEYDIEPMSVWTLDVAFTTGRGKAKERDTKTGIYKIELNQSYSPKMDSARELLKEKIGRAHV